MRRRSLKDRSLAQILVGKAQLCPGCKLDRFRGELPKTRSYTRQPIEKTTHRLCQDLRTFARRRYGLECDYYRGMDLNMFLRSRRKRR